MTLTAAELVAEARQQIREIQQRLELTTIFVTHDQEEALSISDRIVVMNGGIADQVGTPFEIYNRPTTRFVAQFVGQLNTFSAEVLDGPAGRVSVAGVPVTLPVAVGGSRVDLAARPEAVRLGRGAGDDVVLPATVREVHFLGSVIRITAEVAGGRVALDTFNRPDAPPPVIGAAVELSLAARDLIRRVTGRPVGTLSSGDLGRIGLLGLAQTALQYVFFYVGLAHTTGVRASIFNATGTFFSVLLAHFIYTNDRLNRRKTLGCLVGFAGVMAVNLRGGHELDAEFTLLGDGFIVIAAFVLSAASILGKRLSQQIDAMVMTGWQLGIGGMVLTLLGHALGGELRGMGVAAASLLLYMAILSAVAFALWAALLKHNRVGMVSVFNFLIPVFGALLSALFLGEEILAWRNAVALLLVCGGIWLVTAAPRPTPAPA